MSTVMVLGAILARLCPMSAIMGPTGHLIAVGPTLARIIAPRDAIGARFLDLFEVLRPHGVDGMAGLVALEGRRIRLRLRAAGRHTLKGVVCGLPDDGALGPAGGVIVNLSFGITVVEAVRDFSLTGADFAATDQTTEMLYLLEAKSVAMEESRRLNLRLEGARFAAQEQALTDPLTGLRNRRAFDDALKRSCRGLDPFALLHLDLDYFKQVNDTYGHAAGDLVLRVAARRMQAALRLRDVIARIGGDEFAILLPGVDDVGSLDAVANRLAASLEEPVTDGARCYRISVSIGGTLRRFHTYANGPALLEAADQALYIAKEAGRGRHVVHDPGKPPPVPGTDQGVETRSR
ncbi:MAG: GGDEF domain-containing protein [Roseovarius sp.]|nr:GGDEF domain-containing protein [Roseovarius sp.]